MQTIDGKQLCLGRSRLLSTGRNSTRRYATAIIFACATCFMTQSVIALPEVTKTKSTYTETTQSGVVETVTVQPASAVSAVVQTIAINPKSAKAASIPAKITKTKVAQPKPARKWVTVVQPTKKKIVFIQFDVANSSQVNDINNIYDGLPAAFSRRMGASKHFLSSSSPYSLPESDAASQQQAITQIASQTGAQFLISGLVIDAGIHQGTRYIEAELKVYDGFTGVPLLSRRFTDQTNDDLLVGNDKPFGSNAFFDTDFGQAINRLIDTAVKEIQDTLLNRYFAAHIIRIEGNKVFIDAGANSLLKPGYKLVAYTNEIRNPVNELLGSKLGNVERPADVITLTDVKPEFSIGQMPHTATALDINAGSVAKINAADQHYLVDHPVVIKKIVKAKPVKAKTIHRKVKHKAKRRHKHKRAKAKKKTKINPCSQLAALRAACLKK